MSTAIINKMNYSFEKIRATLKKYNFEENPVPPKLVLAGKNFLDIDHKKKPLSQFIIGVREYYTSEQYLFDQFMDQLETEAGRRPLSFPFDNKEALETAIIDFEDYFDVKFGSKLFQRLGSSTGSGELRYCLVVMVVESCYYHENRRQTE